MSKKCTAIAKNSGRRCRVAAMKDRDTCFFHSLDDPAVAELHRAGCSNGGKALKSTANLEPELLKTLCKPPETPQQVVAMLSRVCSAVASTGSMSPRSASTLAYCSGQLIRAMEAAELSDRLQVLEERFGSGERVIEVE